MENKPEYEVRVSIFDLTTGEEVQTNSAFIPNEKRVGEPVLGFEDLKEESAETAFWDCMRHFRNGGQQAYERDNYQQEDASE